MPSPELGATTPAASPATSTSLPLSHLLSGLRGIGAPSFLIVLHLSNPARLLSSEVAVFRSNPWCPVPIPIDALLP